MDYYQIGQQIRSLRRAHGISQEQLAEKIGISVTHMSHIETGNTKLSLPVFVQIADILEVHLDDLIPGRSPDRQQAVNELTQVAEGCSVDELRIITDIAGSAKAALLKYGRTREKQLL